MDTVEFDEIKKTLYLTPLENGRKRLVAADKVFCNVSKKYGTLNIYGKALEAMHMTNSWYKLAFDSTNQIIAWKVRKELLHDQMQETGWKFFKPSEKAVQTKAIIGVGRILDTFKGLKQESYSNLEIKKYKDKGMIGDGDDDNFWYFVQIEDLTEPKKVDNEGNEI